MGTVPPPTCPVLAADPAFERLELDGVSLGRPYAAWGLSDDDFYVAVGVETNNYPSLSSLAAVAHWNGVKWTIDRLPPVIDIRALAGRPGELWIVGTLESGGSALLRNRDSKGWEETPFIEQMLAMTLLGPQDGWLAGVKSRDSSDGVLYRIHGDSWTPEPAPPMGQRYGLQELHATDAQHVYGRGYAVAGNLGAHVLAALDGSEWKIASLPSECGTDLGALASAMPGFVYTLASAGVEYRLCRVSSDLISWTPIGDFSARFLGVSLVATGAGTLFGTWDSGNMVGAPVLIARGDAIISCPGPALYDSVTWVAPGSSNVHVFSATRYGPNAPGYHWVARIDP